MTTPTETGRVWPRVGAAGLIAVVTYVAWLLLWVVGAVSIGLGAMLIRRPVPLVMDLGDTWQWVVGAAAGVLVVALLTGSRHTRIAATVWLGSLIGLAALSVALVGLTWGVPVALTLVATGFAWSWQRAKRAA